MGGEEERRRKIAKCAEALDWAMANVDELRDDLVRKYVLYMKGLLEEKLREEGKKGGQLPLQERGETDGVA